MTVGGYVKNILMENVALSRNLVKPQHPRMYASHSHSHMHALQ